MLSRRLTTQLAPALSRSAWGARSPIRNTASSPPQGSLRQTVGTQPLRRHAALVIADAAKRLLADRKDFIRDNMRDYIWTAKVKTLQGTVSCDTNGDIQDRTISIFQIKKDTNYAAADIVHRYHYVGVAPQS